MTTVLVTRATDGLGCSVATELSGEHLRRLGELFPPGAAAGDRYAPAGMRAVER